MNYAAIKNCDIADGPGVRVALYVSGCNRHCPGCHNQEAQDFEYGKPFDKEVQQSIVDLCCSEHIAGLSILGGEPFDPQNVGAVLDFARYFYIHCNTQRYKSLWIYTGYTLEELLARNDNGTTRALIHFADVLVDGPFIASLHNINLKYRGSSNQRIIDVQQTFRNKWKPVLWYQEPVYAKHSMPDKSY